MTGEVVQIALASTDGKVINQHFGRADAFHIVSLHAGGYRFVEQRATPPMCLSGEHSDGAMADAVALLLDCKAVLASKIGPAAKRALEMNRISVFEIGLPIDDALEQLRAYYFQASVNRAAPTGAGAGR